MSRKTKQPQSPTALAQQLDQERRRRESAEARAKALAARLLAHEKPTKDIDNATERRKAKEARDIIERLAEALQHGAEASHPMASSNLDTIPGNKESMRDNSRPSPGASVTLPRRRVSELVRSTVEALDRFWWAAENDWKRKPHPRAEIPKLRCRRTDCPAEDIHVDAWYTVRGGKTIYREVCASCGTPYPKEET